MHCPREKRIRDRTRNKGEKIAISRGGDVALYHGNGPFSFETDVSTLSPEFLNPMPAIMGRAKTPTRRPVVGEKASGNVNFIYFIQCVRPRDGRLLCIVDKEDSFFSFFFLSRRRIVVDKAEVKNGY